MDEESFAQSLLTYQDKMEVLKERFGGLFTLQESLKNLLFIKLQRLEKKEGSFFMGIREESQPNIQ